MILREENRSNPRKTYTSSSLNFHFCKLTVTFHNVTLTTKWREDSWLVIKQHLTEMKIVNILIIFCFPDEKPNTKQ
jgi:hypothetical protein